MQAPEATGAESGAKPAEGISAQAVPASEAAVAKPAAEEGAPGEAKEAAQPKEAVPLKEPAEDAAKASGAGSHAGAQCICTESALLCV